jgi:hypothetical protein
MRVERIDAKDWATVSEFAHTYVFNSVKPASTDRIDYALLVTEASVPMGYVTVRELDHETVYWQFGGAFPKAERSLKVLRGYKLMLEWTRRRYGRIRTYIANDNLTMLKLAMRVGFRINGVRLHEGKILVEHELRT